MNHLIIDNNGVREFPKMSPCMLRLYEKLLENPFRVVPFKELAASVCCSESYIRSLVIELRTILERERLGTVYNLHGHGYSLRRR